MNNRLPRNVYVVDTTTNRKVIEILKAEKPLSETSFLFVPQNGAADSLRDIEGKAILMWADGSTHHLSYHFDMRGSKMQKRIVDNHDDFDSGFGFALLTCANHAGFSAAISDFRVQLALTPWCEGYLNFLSRLPAAKGKSIEMIRRHVVPVDAPYDQNTNGIHLSLDFDAINLFPAEVKWMTLKGFSAEQAHAALDAALLTGKLMRLDFGGLADGLGNNLDPSVFKKKGIDISRAPDMSEMTREDIVAVVEASKSARDSSGKNKRVDEMCTLKALHYALHIYYRTLVESMFDPN